MTNSRINKANLFVQALILTSLIGLGQRLPANGLAEPLAEGLGSGEVRIESCRPENEMDTFLFSEDFKWGYSLGELINRFVEIYDSSKRLKRRAYWDSDSGRLMLPNDRFRGGDVHLPQSFVKSVAIHIEEGLKRGVVDGVFFPDMGHSHFFIPTERFESHYRRYQVNEFNLLYEDFFNDPSLKVLYHTAEQLTMLDEDKQVISDPKIKFRHQTRNLVGSNDGKRDLIFLQNPDSAANTAGEMKGYYYWGAGFNVSASQDGCFSYVHQGKVFFFDLSLYDLESKEILGGY